MQTDDYLTPEKNRVALVIIDTQRDFVLPGAPATIPGAKAALPRMQAGPIV
jgi:nicotinamidase-related amidase